MANEDVRSFYESLATHYHLIFENWDHAIERQAGVLSSLMAAHISTRPLKILDCACGIGTQAIGLAQMGHVMFGSDLSSAAITRARSEANTRSLNIPFQVADMTTLAEITEPGFDVVMAVDNALPHLSAHQLTLAARAIASKLKPGGLFLASTRDYDHLQTEHPVSQPPAFYGEHGHRRIIHQVWDWLDNAHYQMHFYITTERDESWTTHHFVSHYRCLLRQELTTTLQSAGFSGIRWLAPSETGFYQPIVLAMWPG